MNDCLASTGATPALPLVFLAAAAIAVGLILFVAFRRTSRRPGAGFGIGMTLAAVVAIAGLSAMGTPPASASVSAVDCEALVAETPTSTATPTPTVTPTPTPTPVECGINEVFDGESCVCDEGYIDDGNGNCVIDEQVVCDANEVFDGESCVCDEGYIDDGNGNCVIDIPVLDCPSNEVQVGEYCICRDGYARLDGSCVRISVCSEVFFMDPPGELVCLAFGLRSETESVTASARSVVSTASARTHLRL